MKSKLTSTNLACFNIPSDLCNSIECDDCIFDGHIGGEEKLYAAIKLLEVGEDEK